MPLTRRDFIRDGCAALTVGFAAPSFLSDLARVQGASSRTLVVLDLQGGNDSLSMLIPYTDSFYYSRRPTIGVPAGQVLQIGSDAGGKAMGLHPRLTGLRSLFDDGQVALIQRTGYENSSRSHFLGTDIWSTANPAVTQGSGWLGRYLDSLPAPVDPLMAWAAVGETPHTLLSKTVSIPSVPSASGYTFQSPNSGAEALNERTTAQRLASGTAPGQTHLTFVNGTIQSALATLDRVASVAQYNSTLMYPPNSFGQALRTVAGAIVKGVGTRIFWVQTGGYDNHSSEGTNETTGTYTGLMATLGDALLAFCTDLGNQGLLDQTLILQFSEFSRRITENGSRGTDHGAAGVMMAIGGRVRGGIYGTAPSLNPDPQNPTLENSAADVRFETDFRSVYARVIDQWLGANSLTLLGGDFRKPSLTFI
jgi:uncharacterized protein (DUF1501 family)